jgi:hypothetical protein
MDVDMYKELRADIRAHTEQTEKGISEVRHGVERVDAALDRHVRDEMVQYSMVLQKLARLETRWGIVAATASIIGASVMAGIMTLVNKVFF